MDERGMEEEGKDREGEGWGIKEKYFQYNKNCKIFIQITTFL
jgi:hypothetical protein